MSVGDNIRDARINQRLNQKELAKLLTQRGINVGNTTISNWENGTSKPDPDIIEVLCKILEVDANYILGFKTENENHIEGLTILYNKVNNNQILNDNEKDAIKAVIKNAINRYNENTKG